MNDVGSQLKELATSLKGVFNDPIKGFGVISDYALRRAHLATGIDRFGSGKHSFTKLDSTLSLQQEIFEDCTRDLASAVDRTLRKYGKNIIGRQFTTKRLADMMIDLFVLACVLSRVNSAIAQKGASGATQELDIVKVFANQVKRRVRANLTKLDVNDDDVIERLAKHALDKEAFSWDTL
jgi:hypothetical protein